MGKTVDTRVVEMQFNNAQFEKEARSSIETLENLNKSLNLDAAADNFSFATELITGAVRRLGEGILDLGVKITKGVTLDPIISGLKSYEDQIGSVQVIMNATGRSIEEVEKNMDQLVWFADETSYSMDQMTSATSRFVANNIPLEDSVTAIQGIANMSALAGVNGQKAAIAFYNFADAIGKGGLSAIDYKSLELANITTSEFKQTAIDAAIAVGQLGEQGQILEGTMKGTVVTVENFKNTLSEQASGMWYNNEVIMKQTARFGEYTTAVYEKATELGISAAEAMRLVSGESMELGKKAFKAAQEAKTLTDALNYTRDALISGWAVSWKMITGNYVEATALFSGLSELLYEIVVQGGEARNTMLLFWKEEGGRQAFLEGLDYLIRNLKMIIGPIKEGFREIFPKKTGEDLVRFSEGFRDLMANFKMTLKTSENLKNTFKGLFAVMDIGKMAVGELFKFVGKLINLFAPAGSGILGVTGGLGEFLVSIRNLIKEGHIFEKIFDGIIFVISKLKDILSPIASGIAGLFGGLTGKAGGFANSLKDAFTGDAGAGSFADRVRTTFTKLGEFLNKYLGKMPDLFRGIIDRIREFSGVDAGAGFFAVIKGIVDHLPTLEKIVESVKTFVSNIGTNLGKLSPIFQTIWNAIAPILGGLFNLLKTTFEDLTLQRAIEILNSILSVGLLKTLMNLTGAFSDLVGSSANFIDSLANVLNGAAKALKAFAFSVKAKAIKNIAISLGILVAALIALSFVDLNKIIPAMAVITVLMGELVAAMAVLGKTGKVNTKTILSMGLAFVGLSAGVLLLASAMTKIADLNWEQIAKGLLSVTILMAELVLVAKLLGGNAGGLAKAGAGFLALSGGLLLLTKALETYASFDTNVLQSGLIKIGLAITTLGLALKLMPKNVASIAAGLLVLSVSLFAIAGAMALYSKISIETLAKGLLSMAATLVTLGLALKVVNANIKTSASLLVLSVALTALVVPLLLLSKLSFGDIIGGITAIATSLAILVTATKFIKKDAGTLTKLGVSLIAFGLGFKVLSMAIKDIDPALFAKTLVAVGGAALILTILSKSGNSKGAVSAALGMAVVFTSLAAVFYVLSTFSDVDKISKIITVMTGMMVGLAAVVFAMSAISTTNVKKGIGALSAVVALMIPVAAIITAMSLIGKADAVLPIAASLGLLMTALSGVVAILSFVDAGKANKGLVALGAITGIAAAMGTILGLISLYANVDAIIPSAVSLSLLMNALAAVVAILSLVKAEEANKGLIALGVITAIAAAAGAVLALISLYTNVEALIPTSVALGVLMNSMAAVVAILSLVKAEEANKGLFALGIITAIAAAIGAVLGWISTFVNVDSMIPIAESLGNLMLKLSAVILIISKIRSGDAIGPMVMLAEVVAGMVIILGALGALSQIPGFDWLMSEGTVVLEQIGAAIGGFVGNIIGGLVGGTITGFASSLPGLGQSLTDFMTNVQGFVEGAKKIDASVLDGVGRLVGALMMIIAGDLVDSLLGWITGDVDFNDLKSNFEGVAECLVVFAEKTSELKTDKVKSAADAASALFKAFKEIPNTGGLISLLTGDNNPEKFAPQMIVFGESLKTYGEVVTDLNTGDIHKSASAAKALFDALGTIPNTGGFIALLVGDNSPDVFGPQMETFGRHLKNYGSLVSKLEVDAVTKSASAAKTLFDSLGAIPNTGGFIALLTGDNDPGVFGPQMEVFGNSLKAYGESVLGLNTGDINRSAETAKILFESLGQIPNTGGFIALLTGDNDPGVFGPQMEVFGNNLKAYGESVTGLNVDDIKLSATVGEILFETLGKIPNEGGFISLLTGDNNPGVFGPQMEVFGDSLKAYGDSVNGLNTNDIVSSANASIELFGAFGKIPSIFDIKSFTYAEDIKKFGESLSIYAGYMTSGVNSAITESIPAVSGLMDVMASLGNVNIAGGISTAVSSIFESINNAIQTESYQQPALNAMTQFVEKLYLIVKDSSPKFTQEFTNLMTNLSYALIGEGPSGPFIKMETLMAGMISRIDPKKFIEVGEFVITSLITGLGNKEADLYKASVKSAKVLEDGIRDATGIHSESKVFNMIGGWVPTSIASGIEDKAPGALQTVKNFGSNAVDTLKNSLTGGENIGSGFVDNIANGVMSEYVNVDFVGYLSSQTEKDLNATTSPTSPTTQAANKSGSSMVDSAAKGIENNKNAEKAAEEKAKSIVDSFSKGLSELGNVLSTIDLEFQLFEAKLGYVSPEDTTAIAAQEAEVNAAKLESSGKKLAIQNERVALAQEEYNQTLAAFGADSDYTTQAYNKLLQEQIKVAQMTKEIDELHRTQEQKQSEYRQSSLEASVNYYKVLTELQDQLAGMGFSEEDIAAAATQRTGYDPKALQKKSDATIATSVQNSMESVSKAYSESVESSLDPVAYKYGKAGELFSTLLGKGIAQMAPKVIAASASTNEAGLNQILSKIILWVKGGRDTAQGYANGMMENIGVVIAAGGALGTAALEAAMRVLMSRSPSRAFYNLGYNSDVGYANAVRDYTYLAKDASGAMAQETIDTMAVALKGAQDVIGNIGELQPTIRPVVNLDDVRTGANDMNAILNRTIALGTTSRKAGSISTSRNAAIAANQNGSGKVKEGATFNFEQNNYSPKALSRLDIYRNTKNQFSTLKGLVNAQ